MSSLYEFLPLSQDEIRVLSLLPGTGDDELSGTLRNIKLGGQESGTYKALSYAWGDPTKTDYILINGERLPIHRNLYEALRGVRSQDAPLLMWTDAICINQENGSERNEQVAQMGEIYSDSEVLIWLGEVPEGQRPLQELGHFYRDTPNPSNSELLQAIPLFESIFSRPWFERLWILQEAVLAPNGTVALGRESWPLSEFLTVSVKLSVHWAAIIIKEAHVSVHLLRISNLIMISGINKLRNMVTRRQLILQYLIRTTSRLKCKDLRDRIYGLAGIMRRIGLETDVDYGKSAVEVFVDFTVKRLLNDLNTLFVLHARFGRSGLQDLPSWTPDFSGSGRSRSEAPIYRFASGGSSDNHIVRVSHNGNILEISGFKTGHVTTRSRLFPVLHEEQLRLWIFEVEDMWLQHANGQKAYGNWDAVRAALVSTLVQDMQHITDDMKFKRLPSLEEDNCMLEIFLGRAMPWPTGNSCKDGAQALVQANSAQYINKLKTGLSKRIIFFTDHGYIGQAPEESQIGDIVVVVPSVNKPMILRKKTADNTFQYIGLAYVHGIMDGEFMSEAERKGIQPQMFSLV